MDPDPARVEFVVLGAGPCGLGAARRLEHHGADHWLLLEAEPHPGGLASSFVDDQGFTWDIGGHVQFSHYEHFDEAMDEFLGPDGWNELRRESWIWFDGRFVPYPLQNNLHRLDADVRDRFLADLEAAQGLDLPSVTFLDWLRNTFGASLSAAFLEPYNAKVWAHPLDQLGISWVDERVAIPDPAEIRARALSGEDDVAWGPNATFRFPKQGGTGAIWAACAALLPAERISLGERAIAIDLAGHRCTTSLGRVIEYGSLISTIPLDSLVGLTDLDGHSDIIERGLKHSSSNIVGLGMIGQPPEDLREKCWMYFPGDECPFYRATVFSNYAEANVPRPGETWSLMLEVAESPHRPVDHGHLVDEVIAGAVAVKLVTDPSTIISTWKHRAAYGYPTPGLDRDEALRQLIPALEDRDVYSRGRFGMWRYEVSNQDHSFMQGVEVVDRIILGTPEATL